MDGGPIAKRAFRYQDWCAMYFALDNFKGNFSLFEHVYCEQGKLDFEIWHKSTFTGFQVKTSVDGLTANEVNRIFLYYLNKSQASRKRRSEFRFIFGEQPRKSLQHLFNVTSGNSRGVRYSNQITKYINTALYKIPTSSFFIDFYCFNEQQIKDCVFSRAAEVLNDKLEKGAVVSTEIVNIFITKFRDEIDKISCKPLSAERVYSVIEIDSLITTFLATYSGQRLENEGGSSIQIKINVPKHLQNRVFETHVSLRTVPPNILRSPAEAEGNDVL